MISPLTGNLAAGGNDLTGLDELQLNDAAANATAAGRLRRNGAALTWHNGTNAQNVVLIDLASGTQDISKLDEVEFTDALANAAAAGRLRRNAARLTFHDGTASRRVLTDAMTADTATGFNEIGFDNLGNATAAGRLRRNLSGEGLTWHDGTSVVVLSGPVATDATERTTTSLTTVDLSTLTVSIPVGRSFKVIVPFRKTAGAAAAALIGLKLNATSVRLPVAVGSAANQAEMGIVVFTIGARATNYLRALRMDYANGHSTNTGAFSASADMPNVTLTSVIILGAVDDALVTLGVKDVQVLVY